MTRKYSDILADLAAELQDAEITLELEGQRLSDDEIQKALDAANITCRPTSFADFRRFAHQLAAMKLADTQQLSERLEALRFAIAAVAHVGR